MSQIDMGSINKGAVESWNKIQTIKRYATRDISPNKIKAIAGDFYPKSYQ